MGTMDRELLELFYDARQYDWNSPTIRAIEEGIRWRMIVKREMPIHS